MLLHFVDRDEFEVMTKKERRQYPAILPEQAWSIKDFFHRQMENFILWDRSGKSRAGKMGPLYLSRSGSQLKHRIRFI